jgi:hypothetical protein
VLEEARANLPVLEALKGNPGWGLVKGWCVQEANEAIKEWVGGVPQERQLSLASKVVTLGLVIDLVDAKMGLYRKILSVTGEGLEDRGEDEGTTPFISPYERIEEVG